MLVDGMDKVDMVLQILGEFRSEVRERFNRVEEKQDGHGQRLSALEARVTALEGQVAKLNGNGLVKYNFAKVWGLVIALLTALLTLVGVKLGGML